jgi:hypothetical protein
MLSALAGVPHTSMLQLRKSALLTQTFDHFCPHGHHCCHPLLLLLLFFLRAVVLNAVVLSAVLPVAV